MGKNKPKKGKLTIIVSDDYNSIFKKNLWEKNNQNSYHFLFKDVPSHKFLKDRMKKYDIFIYTDKNDVVLFRRLFGKFELELVDEETITHSDRDTEAKPTHNERVESLKSKIKLTLQDIYINVNDSNREEIIEFINDVCSIGVEEDDLTIKETDCAIYITKNNETYYIYNHSEELGLIESTIQEAKDYFGYKKNIQEEQTIEELHANHKQRYVDNHKKNDVDSEWDKCNTAEDFCKVMADSFMQTVCRVIPETDPIYRTKEEATANSEKEHNPFSFDNFTKPSYYATGIDTFKRMEINKSLEQRMGFVYGNIDKYNDRTKGQDIEDLKKIMIYAAWGIKQLSEELIEKEQ